MAISTGAAILGSSVIGALAGSQQQGGSTTTNTPWKAQRPFLKDGFGYAKDAYQNASGMGAYTGQRVAGLNPFQTQGADLTANYALGTGYNGADLLGNTGMGLTAAGAGYGMNANSLFNRASMDPTQSILSNAALYANNPYADGMIDAANRDTQRALTENALPSLARGLTASGNTNNTRGGVESAILQRGAADRMNDTAASIRSNLFDTGLRQSQAQYNQNMSNMLQANQGLLQGYNAGSGAILQGQQVMGNVFDQANAAGGLYQNQNQNMLDANMAQFNEQRDLPQKFASNYMSTVGGNYGGTSSTSGTGGGWGGALSGALGAGMGSAGLIGKLGGFNNVMTPAAMAYRATPPAGGYLFG